MEEITHDAPSMIWLRMALWIGAALLLLAPLVAMQFTDEVNWSGSDFAYAAILLFGSLGVYELGARSTGNTSYKWGAALAILTAFLLLWINGAVGITDSAADAWYVVVVAVGLVGAFVARFTGRGMAYAMFAAALVQIAIGVTAVVAGMNPTEITGAGEVFGITFFYTMLWVGSGLLFRQAGQTTS